MTADQDVLGPAMSCFFYVITTLKCCKDGKNSHYLLLQIINALGEIEIIFENAAPHTSQAYC